jgi:iron complex outermembrane receptor protein
VVRVNGVNLRQRFNQSAATSFGVDMAAQVSVAPGLTVEMTGTALDASADDVNGQAQPQVQRPSHELMAAIDWAPSKAFDIRAELRRLGPARDLGIDGSLVRLPPATEVNLRARLPIACVDGARVSATAAVDNLTNAVLLPQLGLPLPGRTVRLGLMLAHSPC